MSIDQQIALCQDRINQLEDYKRMSSADIEHVKLDLDRAYQQIALLRIRQMMDQ